MDEYISKKKLVNTLKMRLMDLENDMDKGDYGELCENKGAREAVESCICEAEEQPAADVQLVKRGRWIWDSNAPYRDYGAYKCSNCGSHIDFVENYCYNCGAKMEQEDSDTE